MLKPYQVGDYAIVAAEDAQQALSLYAEVAGQDYADEIDSSRIEDLSSIQDGMVYDEDGSPTQTLKEYVDACNGVPQYLYGWD